MKATLETITPSMAEKYLESNTNNRKIKRHLVEFIKDEIEGGRWVPNGATIVMGAGRLLDGQHRLLAVVQAKKPIKTLVVNDVPNEYFSTIDTGAARKALDVLQIKGEKNTAQLASAISWVLRYKSGQTLSRIRASSTVIERFLDDNPKIRASLKTCLDVRIMSKTVAAAGHFLFSKRDATMADLFIDGLINGFTRDDADPFFHFRERMIQNKNSQAKLHAVYQFALMVKAWNLSRKGKKLEEPLRFIQEGKKAEGFPEII